MDGDARGGAALSMRAVTGKPNKFAGPGEKLDGLELFQPSRIACRIPGMGDVVSLVDSAAVTIPAEAAEAPARNVRSSSSGSNSIRTHVHQSDPTAERGQQPGIIPGTT